MARMIEFDHGFDRKGVVFLPEGRQPNPTPIVALHGNWATWRRYAYYGPYFADRGYAFIAPTYRFHRARNHGCRELGTTSIHGYVADVQQVLEATARGRLVQDLTESIQPLTRPPILMGHSMGGTIAQLIASRQDTSAVVLLNSAPVDGISLHTNLRYQWDMIPYLWQILSGQPYLPALRIMSRYVYNGMPAEQHEKIYEGASHESGTASREILAGSGKGPIRWLARLLSKPITIDPHAITCPLLIVGCEKDQVTPLQIAIDLANKYGPDTTLKIFPQFAHWVQYEPGWEASAEYIFQWLSKNLQ